MAIVLATLLICPVFATEEKDIDISAYINNEVFVMYRDGSFEVLAFDNSDALKAGLTQLYGNEDAEVIQPNYTYTQTSITNDEYADRQWALSNDGSYYTVTGYEGTKNERSLRVGRPAGQFGIEMVEFENGGIAKSIHGDLYKNSVWYTIYGSQGRMETAREDTELGAVQKLFVNADAYSGAYDKTEKQDYCPTRDMDELAASFGHGNSDFYTMYNFVRKIQGYEDADTIDVYEALDMFLPGLWAYRSILAGGIPVDVPNLRNKEERDKWRNDTLCVDKKVAGDQWVPAFSKGEPDIPDEVYENMRKKCTVL